MHAPSAFPLRDGHGRVHLLASDRRVCPSVSVSGSEASPRRFAPGRGPPPGPAVHVPPVHSLRSPKRCFMMRQHVAVLRGPPATPSLHFLSGKKYFLLPWGSPFPSVWVSACSLRFPCPNSTPTLPLMVQVVSQIPVPESPLPAADALRPHAVAPSTSFSVLVRALVVVAHDCLHFPDKQEVRHRRLACLRVSWLRLRPRANGAGTRTPRWTSRSLRVAKLHPFPVAVLLLRTWCSVSLCASPFCPMARECHGDGWQCGCGFTRGARPSIWRLALQSWEALLNGVLSDGLSGTFCALLHGCPLTFCLRLPSPVFTLLPCVPVTS